MDIFSILNETARYLLQPITIAYALAAVGLAVHFGFAGLLNFGMAGFMALGSYGYAISVLSFGLPWYFAMLVGLAASALFALILGLPTLRLRADYLAIVTIAAAEIVRLLLNTRAFDAWTGSNDGLAQYNDSFNSMNPFPPGTYGFGPWKYTERQFWVLVFGLIVLAVAVTFVWLMMRSPWGRVFKGIREDEDAVRSLGKNVFAYKMQALIIGGVFGAAGGMILVLPSAVVPGNYSTALTFNLWTALLIGGAATVIGPVLGSALFWLVYSFLGAFVPALNLPMSNEQAGTIRLMLMGIALMLVVIFRPQGLLGDKRELTFVK